MTYNIGRLRRIFKKSLQSAGPRYTPAVELGAPNIEIEHLQHALSGLTCGIALAKSIASLGSRIEEQFRQSHHLKRNRSMHFRYPKGIVQDLEALSHLGPNKSAALVSSLKIKCARHENTLRMLTKLLWDHEQSRREMLREENESEERGGESDSTIRQLRSEQRELRDYQDSIFAVSEFIGSPACQFMNNNCGLLLGSWGSGKTHFLCDQSRLLLRENQPVLLLLAKDFSATPSPAIAITKFTSFANSFSDLIKRLDALGRKSGQRTIFIIDGINEADNFVWKNGIEEIISAVQNYHHVGLLVSCRSPFQRSVLLERTLKSLVVLNHPGFNDIEFHAQSEFFNFYNIPLPEVPLLAEEFSKPLTLKIMCGAFLHLTKREQRKGFHGISSGQRGMTYILEKYINARSKPIEKRLKLPSGTCWKLIKGDNGIADDLLAGVAPYMAATLQDYVPHSSCIEIIKSQNSIPNEGAASQLYNFLVEEGIFQEDEILRAPEDGGHLKVVRLPYQRFGDHIVSRFLLSKYLDTTDENSIRKSLHKDKPIGKIFDITNAYYPRYANESWAEAIIIEFPERVKKTLACGPRELIYYLPKSQHKVSAYADLFVSGLFWRSPNSFCSGTDNFVGHLLWKTNHILQRSMFEVLVSVGTKHDHPYHAKRLFKNLDQLTLVERDLTWSEFIRTSNQAGVIDRVLLWFEHRIPKNLYRESAENFLMLLALMLTTTNRTTRDRVTKVLVTFGAKYIVELFEVTKQLLTFNDIYVRERLLAACYGASMALWHDRGNTAFHAGIVTFSRYLTREIFAPGGSASTTHALALDYASGIIKIGRLCRPGCIASQQVKYVIAPFPGTTSPFPASVRLTKASQKIASRAIRMDFGNYTLGKLCKGRANYQNNHPSYVKVRKYIDWRILNLGYDPNKFNVIDREIGEWNFRRGQSDAGKIDRYGKKYSWIAYFELYGLLNRSDELDKDYPEPRPTDCDIDPSFPVEPPSWPSIRSRILDAAPTVEFEWLKNGPSPNHRGFHCKKNIGIEAGPWVLLHGYITDSSEDLREFTSFIHGYFVAKEDIEKIRSKYMTSDHPANRTVEVGQDYYTFAGEASWSSNFGFHLRTKNGKLRNPMREAFKEYVEVNVRAPISKGWHKLYEETGETLPESISLSFQVLRSDQDTKELENWLEKVQKINRSVPKAQRIHLDPFGMNIPSADDVERGYQVVTKHRMSNGVKMMPTTWAYCWESYHSKSNQVSGFHFPHPIVCQELNLHSRNREIELFDSTGRRASIYRECSEARYRGSAFAYLRKDLLDRYLEKHGLALVWLTWGERGFHYEKFDGLPSEERLLSLIQNHCNIYRRFSTYKS